MEYWWVIFPVMGMIYGLISMMQQHRAQNRALDLLRTYAEQGKEPPAEVLKALADPNLGLTSGGEGGGDAMRNSWWTFFIFIALTAGFAVGYSAFEGDGNGKAAFLVVTVVMGVLAFGALVMALSRSRK